MKAKIKFHYCKTLMQAIEALERQIQKKKTQ